MSSAEQLISYQNMNGGIWYSEDSVNTWIPSGSQNKWSERWYFVFFSPSFRAKITMPYRFLNQPRCEWGWHKLVNGQWEAPFETSQQFEGNTSIETGSFGHNRAPESSHKPWEDVSEHHIWLLYTRRYRNQAGYGNVKIEIGSYGAHTNPSIEESYYDSTAKGELIKGNPKTSFSITTTPNASSAPNAFFLKFVTSDSSSFTYPDPGLVLSYFNTDLVRGTPIPAGQDWRLSAGIQ